MAAGHQNLGRRARNRRSGISTSEQRRTFARAHLRLDGGGESMPASGGSDLVAYATAAPSAALVVGKRALGSTRFHEERRVRGGWG